MDTGNDNRNNVCVAVIDDNARLRQMPVKQLENSGYTVLLDTGNGEDALQKLQKNERLPDVCLVEEDLVSTKILFEKYPDLKILIVSTSDNEEHVTDMLKTGVSGYVLKYADPDEMLAAVKALSENKKYFSVGVSGIATEYFKNQPQS